MFTVGLLAFCRSKSRSNKYIGVMITASHNPAEDNGVKVVDPKVRQTLLPHHEAVLTRLSQGDMLDQEWEGYATTFANTQNADMGTAFQDLFNNEVTGPKGEVNKEPGKILFARDTRESGPHLVKAMVAAFDAIGAKYTDLGIMTTPQLHYMVRATNDHKGEYDFGVPSEVGYYEKLAKAFTTLMTGRKINGSVTVDCANGVGAPKLEELIKYLPANTITINAIKTDIITPSNLNLDCGADFVKTKQRAPAGLQLTPNARYCSLDGDADRLIYYYADTNGTFHMLDGDRIATLSAAFFADLVRSAGLTDKLQIGMVQTAYANGASTKYATETLKVPVKCTSTGVKHLHHAAKEFDIGVYFEANGHGTVLFSNNAIQVLKETKPKSPGQQHALASLLACVDLINQAVGDAISDMLFVEVVLAHKAWSMEDWLNTYIDLPNYLRRVEVKDRGMFTTTDQERKLVTPNGLQAEIDKLVGLYGQGRSFVRASGTEDAVRVYAEAYSKVEAGKLAGQVEALVKEYGS
jgi:phosphoacetylglucosamine mutase